MAFTISDFTSQLTGDGARPNLFNVTLTFPTYVTNGSAAGQKATFMIKSASIPPSSMGIVPQYYFGREIKIPGNRVFPDWNVTIVNDEDFLIRSALENWSNNLNSHVGNVRNPSALVMAQYGVDAIVTQYGKTGSPIRTYTFRSMYPINIEQIQLDWGQNDTIEEYGVTFAYQEWTANSTT